MGYKKHFLPILGLLMLTASSLWAQSPSSRRPKVDAGKSRIHPTRSKTSPTGVYIPRDLPDTFVELQKMLSPALLAEMKRGGERDMIRYHFGLGMWMRNNWGLWKGLRLAQWFNKQGIFHPDDMSGIILASYWRHLNHKPVDLKGQVAYFQAYWKQAKIAQAKEKERVRQVQAAIRSRMLGMTITGKPQQVLALPPRSISGLRIRYMAPFANGILLTAKTSIGLKEDFITPCFFLDLQQRVLHPIRLPEIMTIEEGVAVGGKAYFHGKTNSADALLEVDGKVHKSLPLPPGKGALRLGTDHDYLLAIRPHDVARWAGGQWQAVYHGSITLPRCGVPPQCSGQRLYFRDEGQNEDDKRLSWLDLSAPTKLTYFDADTGLVGPEGPRWENVWSYLPGDNGNLWIATGSSIGTPSLLTWNPADAYHIALFNAQTAFSGDFFSVPPADSPTAPTSATVTGMEVQPDDSLLAIGPRGLYRIQGTSIHPLLAFTNIHQDVPDVVWDWIPTHLLTLNANTWLAGGHWGGLYLLQKQATGNYYLTSLDEQTGIQITL